MSKKRTSPESSIDKQTNEDSDSLQQDENAKRAKLTSLSDTTLHDLPMELIEIILVKAVAMEVMGMTWKNSEWKGAAEPVISRLTTVCLQWTSILATNYFRNELHRTFDAVKSIRLEIVQGFLLTNVVFEAIALKDELFAICMPRNDDDYFIEVYDRNNVARVKDVIPLPGIQLEDVAGCNVSNCLYLHNDKTHHLSILRLTKTGEHQFDISTLINGMRRRYDTLSVAANGNLVLSWQRRKERRTVITVYDPNGQLLHETWLSSDVYMPFFKIIPKSNGNFVLASSSMRDQWQTKLTEIDKNGNKILCRYQSSVQDCDSVCQVDKYDRIAIVKGLSEIELLDSELNLLEYTRPQLNAGGLRCRNRMHYNRERNEVVVPIGFYAVIIFRFTEE